MKLLGTLLALVGKFYVSRSMSLLESAMTGRNRLRLRYGPQQTIVAALVAAEDHRFYRHNGVDPMAIVGAFYRFIACRKLRGASTIEQQLVRVLTGHRERTLKRKLKEMVLASCISNEYSKSDIAEMYLSVAYFGWGMNGVEEASNRLSIDLSNPTFLQAASLAARLKYPQPSELTAERYALIAQRTEHILKRMSNVQNIPLSEVPSDAAILDI